MNVFFATEDIKGLTETSASHLCAVAAQARAKYEEMLDNVSFVDTYMDIVGTNSEAKQTSVGLKDLSKLGEAVEFISKMNSFISWFGEARKAKEAELEKLEDISIEKWEEITDREPLEKPEPKPMPPIVTITDALNALPIKDRQKYLELEAKSAVFGQFIHKNKPMDKARKNLHQAIAQPYDTKEGDHNTLIIHNVPSVAADDVDSEFNRLQFEYREVEKELNFMKSQLRNKHKELELEHDAVVDKIRDEYNIAFTNYGIASRQRTEEFNRWKRAKFEEINKIKLALPDHLKETYDYLSNLK